MFDYELIKKSWRLCDGERNGENRNVEWTQSLTKTELITTIKLIKYDARWVYVTESATKLIIILKYVKYVISLIITTKLNGIIKLDGTTKLILFILISIKLTIYGVITLLRWVSTIAK